MPAPKKSAPRSKKTWAGKTKTVTVPRGVRNNTTGFPKQLTIVHKYVEGPISFSLTGSLIPAVYQWRCNGMFKPNVLTAGHQPMYFDQASLIYNHFTVVSSKFKIEVVAESAFVAGTTSAAVTGCLYIEDEAIPLTPTTIQSAAEQASATRIGWTRSGNPNLILTKTWSARQAFGGDPLSNPELTGDIGTDPLEEQFYTLFLASPAGLAANCTTMVTIEYTAVWNELKNITGS